ncbi:MAG: MAPEG family protein [Xanthomonadales bacterium]|nr:MAPEG family protein [Xanthomonadales bacterium]
MSNIPHVTVLYAGLLGLVSFAIANYVGTVRRKAKVSIGDGGNLDLIAAMRAQANFIEHAPLALIIIGLLEMNGVSSVAVHALGAGLVISRVLHPLGMGPKAPLPLGRFIGTALVALVTLVASIWAIVAFF